MWKMCLKVGLPGLILNQGGRLCPPNRLVPNQDFVTFRHPNEDLGCLLSVKTFMYGIYEKVFVRLTHGSLFITLNTYVHTLKKGL